MAIPKLGTVDEGQAGGPRLWRTVVMGTYHIIVRDQGGWRLQNPAKK